MKILLINTNPVVSRLTALSARKEGVDLDEVKDISEVKNINSYDIVFIDSDIDIKETINFLKKSNIKRKVIFANQEQKDIDTIFNFTILKPFLPSEVSSILREAKVEIDNSEELNLEDKTSSVFEGVKPKEETKEEEEYLDLSRLISTKEDKENSIKEEESSLNLGNKIPIFEIDNKENRDKESSSLVLEKDSSKDEINIENELFSIDNESKNEVDFEKLREKEKEEQKITKILDKDEITNIKSLLDGVVETKEEEEFKLDDIEDMPIPSTKTEKVAIKSESLTKKDEIKEEDIAQKVEKVGIEEKKRVLRDTVGSLPIEELRQLLRGTKINITIEFPKEV